METKYLQASRARTGNCTDPTYKEWKLTSSSLGVTVIISKARILPTRNGNHVCCVNTYKDDFVARILPTRNGNPRKTWWPPVATLSTDPTYKEWKRQILYGQPSSLKVARILPTRNGNKTQDVVKKLSLLCTDPTYKEWKLILLSSCAVKTASTDPTYKEWKLKGGEIEFLDDVGTDPTYKEWKHCNLFIVNFRCL